MSPGRSGLPVHGGTAAGVRRYAAAGRREIARLRFAPRADPLGLVALIWLALEDIPDQFTVASMSGGAVLTLVSVLVIALAAAHVLWRLLRRSGGPREALRAPTGRRLPVMLGVFLAWAIVMLAVHPSYWGVQNVTVYASFVLAIFATSHLAAPTVVDDYLRRAGVLGLLISVVYIATVVVSGPGTTDVYGARSVALGLVLLLAVTSTSTAPLWWSVTLVAAVALSSSRTATVVAVIIFCLSWAFRGPALHRGRRIVGLLGVGALSSVLLVLALPSLRDRFLIGNGSGDERLKVHGLSLNTSGRSQIWAYTWDLALRHRWLGAGPGAAENAINRRFYGFIAHPHDDYLRLFDDLGLLGLALFLVGMAILMRRIWVRACVLNRPVHSAAFLAILAFAACAVTDNPIVYPFFMIPLGVLVGMSLSETLPTPVSDASRHEDATASSPEAAGPRP